ncbi:MAG: hypothetical protein WC895_01025 [Candidatus Shapirobacteria bacterium]|jgi:hypothetical protein
MAERGGDFIKFDISKLSGKGDVLPKKTEERAFLGSDNEGLYRRQITRVAGQLDDAKVIDESTSERETKTAAVLHENFNVYSVRELKDRQQDPNLVSYVRENLKRSEERLAKSVLVSLKNSGVKELDLVSAAAVDEKLPDSLKGLGEKISLFIITEPTIKKVLEGVDFYRNQFDVADYGEKKDLVLGQIKMAEKEIMKVAPTKKREAELALAYLHSLKDEVIKNHEKEHITDEIVTFLDDHIIRKDVTVDENLNLRNLSGVDDFEKKPGTDEYKNPETVKWIKDREAKASDLIMICSGGEFTSIEEIDEKLKEGGKLSPYYTINDGTRGEKEYLEGLKDTFGFCVYETIQDSGVIANKTIFGTLNTNRIDRLLPLAMEGLSDDVVINAAQDPFLKEQLRRICLLDKDKKFSLMRINGGFSDVATKEQLKRDISSIVTKITGDKRMGTDKEYTSEARRIQTWLLDRNAIYQQLILQQEKLGRYGEIMPTESKERYEMARSLLDTVEASGSPPGSLNIMDQVTKLFNMTQSEMVEPELKTEIGARLSLSFMYYHMHAAGGLLNNRGQSIEDAHEQAFKEGLLIDKDAMEFFLKTGANGLPVAECWDAIEDMNFGDSYYFLLSEIVGVTVDKKDKKYVLTFNQLTEKDGSGKFLLSIKDKGLKYLGIKGELSDSDYLKAWTDENRLNFFEGFNKSQNPESIFWGDQSENPMCNNHFTDTNKDRKKIVMEFVLSEIKQKREKINVGKPEADRLLTDQKSLEKGFELAEKLLEATAESSVFNPGFAGHNDFSELILTEANTKDRQKKMKVIGARTAMQDIVSFYTTFPRYIAGKEENEIKSVFGPLYTKDIYTDRMNKPKADSYFLYTAILPKKIEPVQAFFMKEDITPKDVLSVEYWKKLYDPISKVINYSQDVLRDSVDRKKTVKIIKENKEGLAYRLRLLAVKAIVQMASNRPTTGWDWGSLFALGKLVTNPYTMIDLPGGSNQVTSFIKIEDWAKIFDGAELAEDMRGRLRILNTTEMMRKSEMINIKFK